MYDKYTIGVEVQGIDKAEKDLERLGRAAGKPHIKLKATADNTTAALVKTVREFQRTATQMVASSKSMQDAVSNSFRKLEASALSAQQKAKSVNQGLIAEMRKSFKDIDMDKLVKSTRELGKAHKDSASIGRAWSKSTAELKKHLTMLERLREVNKRFKDEATYESAVGSLFGDKAAQKLATSQNAISRRLNMLKKEHEAMLDLERLQKRLQQMDASSKAKDTAAKAVYAESLRQGRNSVYEVSSAAKAGMKSQDKSANDVVNIKRLDDNYRTHIATLQVALDKQVATEKSIAGQAKKLREVQAEYARILQMQNAQERNAARNQFTKKYGADALWSARSGEIAETLKQVDNYKPSDKAKRHLDELARRMGILNEQGRRMHDMWRGLAAASGNLWMSYGNILAMMPGLAAGYATFKSLGVERKFGWEMEQVGIVGAQSANQVAALKQQLLDINQMGSLQGPVEMAEALRVLAQAGLSTKESLESLQPVLNFSLTAGITNEQGALFAAGLRSAFDLNSPDALRAGLDQTAKAADVSQTSIEAMSEALKQASPVAARFGLSVADTSTALALLAKYNIESSAAGTSFRNFLTDLAGRTHKSQKALKELGLSFYDARGQAKPLMQVVDELREKLGTLNPRDQQKWLKLIFDERGMKTASILLGTVGKEFNATYAQIQRGSENMGYTAQAAERLAETSEGAFRKMKNAWEGAFASVGRDVAPQFQGMLSGLASVANDPSVRSIMSVTASLFLQVAQTATGLAKAVAPLAPLLAGVASAMAIGGIALWVTHIGHAIKTSQVFATTLGGLRAAAALTAVEFRAATAANGLLAGSFAGLRTAAVGLSTALGPIGLLMLGAGVATATYMAVSKSKITDFRSEVEKLDKTLGSVDISRYELFNSRGLGKALDNILATGGVMRAGENGNLATALLPPNSVDDFQVNADKIQDASSKLMQRIREDSSQSVEARAELETMLTERKKTLLTEQLQKFDSFTSDQETLSRDAARIRMELEQQVYEVSVDLMNKRTELALEQMSKLRAKAAEEQGFLDSFWDGVSAVTGVGYSEDKTARSRMLELNGLKAKGKQDLLTDKDRLFLMKIQQGQDIEAAHAATSAPMSGNQFYRFSNALRTGQGQIDMLELVKTQEGRLYYESGLAAAKDVLRRHEQATASGHKLSPNALNSQQLSDVKAVITILQNGLNLAKQEAKAQAKTETARTGGNKFDDLEVPKSLQGRGAGGREKSSPQPTTRTTEKRYSFTDYKTANALEDLQAKIQSARDARKRIDDAVKLGMGVDDDTLTKAAMVKYWEKEASMMQEAKKLREEYTKIAKELADGNVAPQHIADAQAQMQRISEKLKGMSAKGQVLLGHESVVTVTKSKIPLADDGVPVAGHSKFNYTTSTASPITASGSSNVFTSTVNGLKALSNATRDASGTFGRCALYVNNAWRKQGYAAYGDGKDVARNLAKLNPNKFKLVRWTQGMEIPDGAVVSVRHHRKNAGPAHARYEAGHVAMKMGDRFISDHIQKSVGGLPVPNAQALKDVLEGRVIVEVAIPTDSALTSAAVKTYGKGIKGNARITGRSSNAKGREFINEEIKTFDLKEVYAQNDADGKQYTELQKLKEAAEQYKNQLAEATKLLTEDLPLQKEKMAVLESQLTLNDAMSAGSVQQNEWDKIRLNVAKLRLEYEEKIAQVRMKQDVSPEAQEQEIAQLKAEANRKITEAGTQGLSAYDEKYNAMSGYRKTVRSMYDESVQYGKAAAEATSSMVGTLSNTFAEFAATGKASMREMTVAVLQDLSRIAARMAMTRLITTAMNAWGGAGEAASNAASNSFVSSNLFAKGGVIGREGVLSAYAFGGVVNSPTHFRHAGGRGLMGESGPEAIMPLTRMPNGDLGVAFSGNAGGGINSVVTVNVVVNKDGSSDSQTDSSNETGFGREIAQQVEAIVRNVLVKETRYGGMLNSTNRQPA